MANFTSGSENLIALPRCDDSTEPLAREQLQVRVFRDVDEAVRSLPNKTAWLRRVIAEAARRELMGGDES
jgi:hypothetical protein